MAEKGSGSGRLDGELLLAEALGCRRLDLYLRANQPLNQAELAGFKELIKRRADGEPVAYIIGRKAFFTLDLEVGPGVLIPRPETETLVEAALELLPEDSAAQVLELGVGSGAVILSLASERPGLALTGTDLSPQALAIARRNAENLSLIDRIEFLAGDLFEPADERRYDLILMNPPYVTEAEYTDLARDITEFEPKSALIAGEDGLDVIRRLVAEAPEHLNPGGSLLFEIGAGQGGPASELAREAGFGEVRVIPDLAGLDRVVKVKLISA